MLFRVTGAKITTGSEVVVEVRATDIRKAEREARKMGLYIASIELVPPIVGIPSAKGVQTSPPTAHADDSTDPVVSASQRSLERRIIGGGILIGVVLVALLLRFLFFPNITFRTFANHFRSQSGTSASDVTNERQNGTAQGAANTSMAGVSVFAQAATPAQREKWDLLLQARVRTSLAQGISGITREADEVRDKKLIDNAGYSSISEGIVVGWIVVTGADKLLITEASADVFGTASADSDLTGILVPDTTKDVESATTYLNAKDYDRYAALLALRLSTEALFEDASVDLAAAIERDTGQAPVLATETQKQAFDKLNRAYMERKKEAADAAKNNYEKMLDLITVDCCDAVDPSTHK